MEYLIRQARRGDAEGIAATHVASWEAFYTDLLPPELLASRDIVTRVAQWTGGIEDPRRLTFVACDESGKIVGFISALLLEPAEAFDAYLQTLYLRKEAARQGLGHELLRTLGRELLARKKRNLVLRVLQNNSARAFYEKHGARLVPEGIVHDEGQFDDVVYAFDDLSRL